MAHARDRAVRGIEQFGSDRCPDVRMGLRLSPSGWRPTAKRARRVNTTGALSQVRARIMKIPDFKSGGLPDLA